MDITEQRETLETVANRLWANGDRGEADAVRNAWAELGVWRKAHAPDATSTVETRVAANLSLANTKDVEDNAKACPPSEPEVYTYWITFWKLASGDTYVPGTHKLARSTPILTCEDREMIALEMCQGLGTIVVLSSVTLVKG